MTMLAQFLAVVVVSGLVLAPLLWRRRQDRRAETAQIIGAAARSALFRALGGESLVAVGVELPSPWRPGRVVLSAPAAWTWLLEPAWARLAAHVPAGYELVVRPTGSVAPPLVGDPVALRRAA
jgi:hypothetical protein